MNNLFNPLKMVIGLIVLALPKVLHAETSEIRYTFTPESGATMEVVERIEIAFENVKEVTTTPEFQSYDQLIATIDDAPCNVPNHVDYSDKFNGILRFEYKRPMNIAGEYVLTIPAGLLSVRLEDNTTVVLPQIVYRANVLGKVIYDLTFSTTPEYGSTLPVLSRVKVAFNEGATVELSENADEDKILTLNGDREILDNPIINPSNCEELVFETPITEEGLVIISIPKNFWVISFDNGQVFESPYITFMVNLTGEQEIEYSFTPENDGEVKKVKEITLKFDDVVKVFITDEFQGVSQLSASLDGEPCNVPTEIDMTSAEEGLVRFVYETPMNIAGKYQLIIPEGIFNIERKEGYVQTVPVITYSTNVLGGINHSVEWTISPADGSEIDKLSEIKICFNSDADVSLANETTPENIKVTNATDEILSQIKLDSSNITTLRLTHPIINNSSLKNYS